MFKTRKIAFLCQKSLLISLVFDVQHLKPLFPETLKPLLKYATGNTILSRTYFAFLDPKLGNLNFVKVLEGKVHYFYKHFDETKFAPREDAKNPKKILKMPITFFC